MMKSALLPYLLLIFGWMTYCPCSTQNATAPSVTESASGNDDIGNKPLFENLKPENYIVVNTTKENVTTCKLIPRDKKLHEKMMDLVENGNRLITVTLNFPDYPLNPLLVNMSNNYKSNEWYRTYDLHAYTLLSFPFNYKVLSLSTLSHGTTEMTVEVEDSPKGCFGSLDRKNKLATAAKIVATDFDVGRTTMYGKKPHACHQFVSNNSGYGQFDYRCCRLRESDGKLECNEHEPAPWVRQVYKYIAALQVIAFLTGPLFLGGVFFKMSLRQRGYEVTLDQPIKGTLQVDSQTRNADNSGDEFKAFKSAIKRPQLLGKQLSVLGSGRKNISIKKLMIYVDESSLICESTVPVGLFKFIYSDIFFCGIKKWEPFTSLFKASLCGPFKCLGLKYLTWGALMGIVGAIVGILFLPFPFYIRLAVYYKFEEREIQDRADMLADLGLERKYEHNLLYYLSPSHPFFIVVFAVYILAFPILILLRMFDPKLFNRVTVDAFRDLKEVFKAEALRLFFTYLFLPLEKFGLLGVILGVLYWPFAIPLFFVIASIYCVPTLYMTCRFLILKRPGFLKKGCCKCPTSNAVENLNISRFPKYSSHVDSLNASATKRVETIEDALLLNNISRKMVEDEWQQTDSDGLIGSLCTLILRLCLGVTCIALMYSVLAIFSEAVGFFIEVIIFTIMGAIVNANSSAKFIAVTFWLIAYCSSCFNSMHSKYKLLVEMIFKQLKDKLHEKIRKKTQQRLDMQVSSAIKYLSLEEEKELQREYVENTRLKYGDPNLAVDISSIFDHLESKNGKLYWIVNSLVMFVDRRDKPRIPKELFLRVSDSENIPDCPGSVPRNMMNTFKQLLYMVVFLSFVILVVVTFNQVYLMSTTNQLLLTLGGGFVPLLVKNFLTPAATTKSFADKSFINYAFEGKVNEIIEDFQQTWPVFDLDFDFEDDPENFESDDKNDASDPDAGSSNQSSFRPPRIHLNIVQSKPAVAGLTGGYDERFDPEKVELVPLTSQTGAGAADENSGNVQITPGLEVLKAHDTEVVLDFADGKCGVRDVHYL